MRTDGFSALYRIFDTADTHLQFIAPAPKIDLPLPCHHELKLKFCCFLISDPDILLGVADKIPADLCQPDPGAVVLKLQLVYLLQCFIRFFHNPLQFFGECNKLIPCNLQYFKYLILAALHHVDGILNDAIYRIGLKFHGCLPHFYRIVLKAFL
ncbi:hypothetical protein D3C73_1206080 [compost metagenome]